MKARTWILLMLTAGAACGGDGGTTEPKPVPGDLIATLSTPNDLDGAVVVRIIGAVSQVQAEGGYRISSFASATVTRAVLTGNIADGDLLRISVPDVGKKSSYVVVVEQAAARDTYVLYDVSSYNVTLRVK